MAYYIDENGIVHPYEGDLHPRRNAMFENWEKGIVEQRQRKELREHAKKHPSQSEPRIWSYDPLSKITSNSEKENSERKWVEFGYEKKPQNECVKEKDVNRHYQVVLGGGVDNFANSKDSEFEKPKHYESKEKHPFVKFLEEKKKHRQYVSFTEKCKWEMAYPKKEKIICNMIKKHNMSLYKEKHPNENSNE